MGSVLHNTVDDDSSHDSRIMEKVQEVVHGEQSHQQEHLKATISRLKEVNISWKTRTYSIVFVS